MDSEYESDDNSVSGLIRSRSSSRANSTVDFGVLLNASTNADLDAALLAEAAEAAAVRVELAEKVQELALLREQAASLEAALLTAGNSSSNAEETAVASDDDDRALLEEDTADTESGMVAALEAGAVRLAELEAESERLTILKESLEAEIADQEIANQKFTAGQE